MRLATGSTLFISNAHDVFYADAFDKAGFIEMTRDINVVAAVQYLYGFSLVDIEWDRAIVTDWCWARSEDIDLMHRRGWLL